MKTILIPLALLMATSLSSVAADKVLFVVPQTDFQWQEYNDPRQALENSGFQVQIAAPFLKPCTPHPESGQGAASGIIQPDLTLEHARAADYLAVVFVGGWGASMYQFAFPGKYLNPEYNLNEKQRSEVNRLVNEFYTARKPTAAICAGVTVLAWARVTQDGKSQSPLQGRTVVAYEGDSPPCRVEGRTYDNTPLPTRWHMEKNGATMLPANSVGDPQTDEDDVRVDLPIITAQNSNTAKRFGTVLVEQIRKSSTDTHD